MVMRKREIKIILDTNIFINPDARYLFGKTPQEALNNFLEKLDGKDNLICFMPPSIYTELGKFVGSENISKKSVLINKKPPSKYELTIPSLMFYEFIDEMRNRINKGLRVAEKHIRKTAQSKDEQEIIKSLREEYRVALREGIVDSKEDCDLLILTKELGGYLATTDTGLIHWAKKLGINCISPQELNTLLE
ncbi:MAG: RNA ligase partner protein [Candidatus Omnitrophota bacterium]